MHDSDTESESDVESSLVGWLDLSSSEPTSSPIRQTVTMAIRSLQNVPLADIAATNMNVEDLHRKILEASNTINRYLEGIISNRQDAVEELQLFASLVNPSFLAVLFAQRRIFHKVAAKALAPGTRASTVVCWVDGLIAKLAEATTTVACGTSIKQSVSGAMRTQLEDDGLRAAAQLPEKWLMVPSVISSNNASPAAKRLAIQLTFAVYIVGPRLQGYNPWSDCNTPQASDVSKILDQYTLATSANEAALVSYSTEMLLEQMRMTYAMIVSLFAASDSEIRRNRTASPFRPRTLGGLLAMIQLILYQTVQEDESCIAPCENLDSAQIILLQWGDTVFWCWETWNDSRVANTDCITQLTATWLYHLNLQGGSSTPYQDIPNAHFLLEKNPSAANWTVVQVLHRSVMSLLAEKQSVALQDTFFTVLSNSCYAIDLLLRNELIHGRTLAGAETTGKCLLSLFALLYLETEVNSRLDLNATILESLTLLDERGFDEALTSVCEDKKFGFVERIEEMILQSRRKLVHSMEPGNDLQSTDAEELRLVVYFLVRLWHSVEGRKRIQRQPILNLLSSLINRLLRGDLEPLFFNFLREAVVTGFCILDTDVGAPTKSPKQGDVWKFSLDAGSSNLIVASSFAHHIMATEHFPDPLSCAEAWDLLRDTMTLIFRRHFMEDEKPIALLVSLGICGALLRLLDADASTVQFILTSPWTMSFCAELKKLLQTAGSQTDYCRLLKDQLAPIGDVLLDAIRSKLDSGTTASMKEGIPKFHSRLVYHGQYPHYSLVVVPRMPE